MNPNSNYYLAINMGFPNAYDRSNGRTGAFLMIHGDCSSRGCYAMTDEQIAEIYALARESFFGGQKSFQIQAYPFRMTPVNMAKHRNSPHMAFWKMLKQGYDHFEVTRHEPKVDVCEKRYVFDAELSSKFSAADRCPAYKVPAELVAAVRDKQRRDEMQTAELISRGTPAAPVRTGTDGGMNPTFLAAVKSHGGPGANIRTAVGTIPAHVNPPGANRIAETTDRQHHEPRVERIEAGGRAALVGPGRLGGAIQRLRRDRQLLRQSVRIEERERAAGRPRRPTAETRNRRSAAKPQQTAAAGAIRPKPIEPQAKAAAEAAARASKLSRPARHRRPSRRPPSRSRPSRPATRACSMARQPTVPSGGFENRFGSWR